MRWQQGNPKTHGRYLCSIESTEKGPHVRICKWGTPGGKDFWFAVMEHESVSAWSELPDVYKSEIKVDPKQKSLFE